MSITKIEFDLDSEKVTHMSRDQIISYCNHHLNPMVHDAAQAIELTRSPRREESAKKASTKVLGTLEH